LSSAAQLAPPLSLNHDAAVRLRLPVQSRHKKSRILTGSIEDERIHTSTGDLALDVAIGDELE